MTYILFFFQPDNVKALWILTLAIPQYSGAQVHNFLLMTHLEIHISKNILNEDLEPYSLFQGYVGPLN